VADLLVVAGISTRRIAWFENDLGSPMVCRAQQGSSLLQVYSSVACVAEQGVRPANNYPVVGKFYDHGCRFAKYWNLQLRVVARFLRDRYDVRYPIA
jgi:hypothetical protein